MRKTPSDKGSGQTSLRMIAERAGVSIMTVSNALRGKTATLSKATSHRILGIARELKYRPNLLIQGIQTGFSRNIGLMVRVEDAFGSGIVRGVHDALAEHGWLAILHWPKTRRPPLDSQAAERDAIHALLDRRVDGIILVSWHETVEDMYFREVWERGIPMVTVDRALPKTRSDFVGTDDALGARELAGHLLGLGHRRLAVLTGPLSVGTYAERTRAFLAVAEAGGARCEVVETRSGTACTAEEARRLLKTGATGVFLAGGLFARTFYEAAAGLGRRIGPDVSAVTFASRDMLEELRPAMTFACQDPVRIGSEAVRLLLNRIAGRTTAPDPVYVRLAPTLVIGASSGPPTGNQAKEKTSN